ncbi:MAG: TlyA family RNA methyltransferase [Syntrophomonadaceae bacterium]|nr:TlyA family RNA methyltransferase [Syntrophomonadaceae bacterium]
MAKTRLDNLMMARGMAPSREKARAIILAGEVKVNGLRVDKPGTSFNEEVDIVVENSGPRYVSRGGLKLEKAIQEFNIDFTGAVVLDVGASTGGYTDCALQHGAARVFALDVGYGQLDWKLRNDPQVVCLERINIRYFQPEQLGQQVDIITIDVSFISTTLVFPVIKDMLKSDGQIISLIKPQFEAGRNKVGKKGVVRDPEVHREVLINCIASAAKVGLFCTGITYSPITGPQGNIEFFIRLNQEQLSPELEIEKTVALVVNEAHQQLGGKGI